MSYPVLTNLDLNGNQLIQALAEVLGVDPSTLLNEGRFWVNSATHKFKVRLNGISVSFYADTTTLDLIALAAANLNLNGKKITSLGAPTAGTDAATKNYIDAKSISDFNAAAADVSMGGFKITLLALPTAGSDAASKSYVDTRSLSDFTGTPSSFVSFGSQRAANLADPTAAQDAATKNYVDTLSQGLAPKESVRIASTVNIASLSGLAAIDGVTPVAGDRLLVKDQSTGSQNGIYVAAAGAWARALDADSTTDIESAFVFVEEGTQAGTMWVQTTDAVTIGTTAQTWVQFAAVVTNTAGAGLSLTGTVLAVNVDNSTIEINADTLRVKDLGITDAKINDVAAGKITGNVPITHGGTGSATAAAARTALGTASCYTAVITGDGATTAFNVDHNLGTKKVVVQVWDIGTDMEILVDKTRSTVNRVIITFATAPVGGGSPKTYDVVVFAIA